MVAYVYRESNAVVSRLLSLTRSTGYGDISYAYRKHLYVPFHKRSVSYSVGTLHHTGQT